MIRLFVALGLPESLRVRLAGLGGGVPGARWLAPEALHVTLRFVGEIEDGLILDLDDALARVEAPAFALTLAGVGQFAEGRRSHLLWVGVERNEALSHLQAKVESAVVRAGFPPEARKFIPHVTLARLKEAPAERVARFFAGNGLFRSEPVPITSFSLFRSHQGRSGATYEVLSEYPLGPEPPA